MEKTSLVVALCVSLATSAVGKKVPESKSDAVTFVTEGKSLSAQNDSVDRTTSPAPWHPPASWARFHKAGFRETVPSRCHHQLHLWAAATGSRPDIIGRKIRAGDQEFVVVAVAPKSPAPFEGMKVWLADK